MSIKIKPVDFVWGYLAQGLNIGAGILLLPLIVHFLPVQDVGLWFVFVTLASLAQLLELGFQPTVARNAAYINSGAAELQSSGVPKKIQGPFSINQKLLSDLLQASKIIYRYVGIAAAFVLLIFGTLYIYSLVFSSGKKFELISAWIFFATGYVLNFYFGYLNGMLQGRGDITQANKVVVITRSLFIVVSALAIILGLGLIGLGIASFASSFAGRVAAHRYFYRTYNGHSEKSNPNDVKSLMGILWHNAGRYGAVQAGAFLIQRANILLASSFLGLAASASYGMAITIFMALASLSMVFCQIQIPRLNMLQIRGRKRELGLIYGATNITVLLTFVFLACCFYYFGDTVFRLIGSSTALLDNAQMAMIGLMIFLEVNHGCAATYLMTKNNVPFVKAAVWSGLFTLLISLALVTTFGVWGLIFAQAAVQAMYNNWKWPVLVVADLGGRPCYLYIGGIRTISKRFSELLKQQYRRLA